MKPPGGSFWKSEKTKRSQPSKIDYAAKIFELQEFGLHAIYMKCEFSFRFCFSPDFVLAIFVISL